MTTWFGTYVLGYAITLLYVGAGAVASPKMANDLKRIAGAKAVLFTCVLCLLWPAFWVSIFVNGFDCDDDV